jgi:hypothetical protein
VCGSNVDVDAYHRWVGLPGASPAARFMAPGSNAC